MGVHQHARSPYWQLWLETAPRGRQREGTKILVGATPAQRRDSLRLAEEVYHQRMAELARRVHHLPAKRDAVRFREYAAAYTVDVIAHHKGAQREREILRTLLAFFGSSRLGEIDQDLVRQYMTQRRGTVLASTVNREVDLLKSMLRDAVPKHIEASPLRGMKHLRTVRTTKRLLQPDEEARLLAAATDAQDHALLVLGIDTLVRLGDLLDLRRTDRNGLWLMIRDPKMDEPYEVPLSPRAAQALDGIGHEAPYYFERFRRGDPEGWRARVRRHLQRLCAAVTPPIPFGPRGGLTFHGATRKTGATRLLIQQGKPLAVVQKLGNWKTPDVLLGIYTEAQRDDLLDAVGQPPMRTIRGRQAKAREND